MDQTCNKYSTFFENICTSTFNALLISVLIANFLFRISCKAVVGGSNEIVACVLGSATSSSVYKKNKIDIKTPLLISKKNQNICPQKN